MFTIPTAILSFIITALVVRNYTLHRKLRTGTKDLTVWKSLAERYGLRTKQATLTSVKFHARVPSYSGFQKTELKLGLGPCGLTVETLQFNEQADKFTITQIYTNGERKTLDYYKQDVEGRIEKRWAA